MSLAHEEQPAAAWRCLDELDATSLDDGLCALIGEAGSLTRTLRARCNGSFRLRLLGEHPASDTAARVREVLMLCAGEPWVFAQTVMPHSTLANHRWLDSLGERPLGDTLFERPGVQRGELRFRLLGAGEPLFERAVLRAGLDTRPPSLWARRSVICIDRHELTVNEVFLPNAGRCKSD